KIQGPDISFAYHMIAAPAISIIFSSCNEEIIYRRLLLNYLEKGVDVLRARNYLSLLDHLINKLNYIFVNTYSKINSKTIKYRWLNKWFNKIIAPIINGISSV